MFEPSRPHTRYPEQESSAHDITLHGAQLAVEQSDNNNWQTIHFPGTLSVDQLPGATPYLRTNAMDPSSTYPSNGTSLTDIAGPSNAEHRSQREAELLSLVRDLNECNDVLLAKISQLEDSLERSQTALQAEIDCSGIPAGDREIVQLVTELEQSNQALQHHQVLSETLQTELTASRERATQLETEQAILLQQNTEQSQELLQANTTCRDLRARLQRQQRYTLQFKAALEKCLSMSPGGASNMSATAETADASSIIMPKTDKIRPWEAGLENVRLDPQLELMIRGIQTKTPPIPVTSLETEADDQLWHDLARVIEPTQAIAVDTEPRDTAVADDNLSSPFTEPSPWNRDATSSVSAQIDESSDLESTPQLSTQANEIVARIQSAKVMTAADTYLPAVSAQHNPSPLVNPLRPQKRISSLSAIDLPNFPRLKRQPSQLPSQTKA